MSSHMNGNAKHGLKCTHQFIIIIGFRKGLHDDTTGELYRNKGNLMGKELTLPHLKNDENDHRNQKEHNKRVFNYSFVLRYSTVRLAAQAYLGKY